MFIKAKLNSYDETVVCFYSDNGNLLLSKGVSESLEELEKMYQNDGLIVAFDGTLLMAVEREVETKLAKLADLGEQFESFKSNLDLPSNEMRRNFVTPEDCTTKEV